MELLLQLEQRGVQRLRDELAAELSKWPLASGSDAPLTGGSEVARELPGQLGSLLCCALCDVPNAMCLNATSQRGDDAV